MAIDDDSSAIHAEHWPPRDSTHALYASCNF